jgi:pimeloyl-ACP methyl ester carboxylesterase
MGLLFTHHRVLVRDLKRPVFAVDTRNHGDSSHHPTHDYPALAEDLELFLRHHQIKDACLIGHSMGAKIVMTVALRKQVGVGSIIPVDNAPVDAALKSDFSKYIMGMRKIEDAKVKTLKEADKILEPYEQSIPIRQFLLTNLMRGDDGIQKFKVPLKYLTPTLSGLGDFPYKDPEEVRYSGPTLIVRGTQSHYVADDMLPVCGRFFPNFERSDIDAGHWVISEKPEEFRRGGSHVLHSIVSQHAYGLFYSCGRLPVKEPGLKWRRICGASRLISTIIEDAAGFYRRLAHALLRWTRTATPRTAPGIGRAKSLFDQKFAQLERRLVISLESLVWTSANDTQIRNA